MPRGRIAILGWGSLYWDSQPAFDRLHGEWVGGQGPELRLEYSQIVPEKDDGLSLVIDAHAGALCRVGHTFSKRRTLKAVLRDLTKREETTADNIGFVHVPTATGHGHDVDTLVAVLDWAVEQRIESVVWTDTPSNFVERCGGAFSIAAMLRHLHSLKAETKAKVAEYVWRSPPFVDTPLRRVLQSSPWF